MSHKKINDIFNEMGFSSFGKIDAIKECCLIDLGLIDKTDLKPTRLGKKLSVKVDGEVLWYDGIDSLIRFWIDKTK